jgi:hypothetical protein
VSSPGQPLLGVGTGVDPVADLSGVAVRGSPRPLAYRVLAAVAPVLPAWVVSRAVVLAALAIAHLSVATLRPHNAVAAQRVHEGLLSWDAGWYQSIAAHGYVASGTQSVRFFPGFPMVARALAWLPGVSAGTAVIILSNLAALGALAALGVLVRDDLGDPELARRSVWLLALAPPAYALVLGYADSSLLLLAIAALLAARRGRWWWAAAAGLAAGLVRPVGALLVVPVLIEVLRHRSAATLTTGVTATTGSAGMGPEGRGDRTSSTSRLATSFAPFVAIVAPLAGAGSYLAWVGAQFGDALLPFRIQQQTGHRGPLTAPLSSMWHDADSVLHGHHLGSALHIPWVLLCLALLVLAYRRLPVSYAAFATAVLAVSLTSSNLDSFERYALGAFPLVIAGSTLTARRWLEVTVLVVSGAAMGAYALAAFCGLVVP